MLRLLVVEGNTWVNDKKNWGYVKFNTSDEEQTNTLNMANICWNQVKIFMQEE